MDSHNICCSWCAQALVSIHSCNFTNGYSQGQEIDRILLYRIPKKRSYKWINFWYRVHPICGTMGARAEVTNSVLQQFLVWKASKVHQSRFASQCLAWIARQIRSDLSCHISKIQSAFENACVRDSREFNYIVEYAAFASTRGVQFIPDSSRGHCDCREVQRRQFLSRKRNNLTNAVRMLIHPLSWSLTGIIRVCRSSLMVEARDCEPELLSLT